jgi:hypothetical protein
MWVLTARYQTSHTLPQVRYSAHLSRCSHIDLKIFHRVFLRTSSYISYRDSAVVLLRRHGLFITSPAARQALLFMCMC